MGNRLILTHRNVDVDALIALARDCAKAKGIVSAEEFTYERFEVNMRSKLLSAIFEEMHEQTKDQ